MLSHPLALGIRVSERWDALELEGSAAVSSCDGLELLILGCCCGVFWCYEEGLSRGGHC